MLVRIVFPKRLILDVVLCIMDYIRIPGNASSTVPEGLEASRLGVLYSGFY